MLRLERRVRLDLWWADAIGPHRSPPGDMADQVLGLIPELERSGDDLGLTKAWQLVAEQALERRARSSRCGSRSGVPSSTLERAGDRLEENEVRVSMLFVDRHGPATPRDMLARYAEVAAEGVDDRRFEAEVLGCEAVAHAMLGDFELARSLLDRYGEIIRDLGIIYVEYLARRHDLVRRDARRRRGRGGGRDPDRRGERYGAVGRADRGRRRISARALALRPGPVRRGGGSLGAWSRIWARSRRHAGPLAVREREGRSEAVGRRTGPRPRARGRGARRDHGRSQPPR